MDDNQQYLAFSDHYALQSAWIQELRQKDIVVELSGLTIPTQASRPQKNNALKLALFSPHKPCQHKTFCAQCVHHDLWRCETMHLTAVQQEGSIVNVITSTFVMNWRRRQAYMKILHERAQERRMCALRLVSIKDVVGQRYWFAAKRDAVDAAIIRHSDLKTTLRQWMCIASKPMLTPRIWERGCWFLGFQEVGFHYC